MSESLDLKKIDHIGIAVRSLEASLPLYRDIMGLTYLGMETVASEQVRVAFFKLGEAKLELLEPTSEESAIARFIEKKGEGLHHVALGVEGIDGELNKLSEAGLRLIHEQPKRGAGGAQVAFVHPRSTGGVLYELCEPVLDDQSRQKG
ncbi:methylmalonyl-CoA epimerase [Marininema halotolerans]|uniref:Methylmalonyl-CoA/ethylmalonyl-CoA epimerase n=1 Tax=Marininema halotolerans TaxID=1155944 RepID=A0A1I6TTK6_9BACL|nr:methylmalonyl-CoA epimerase [Marininema halotolerans]SFS92494.1 methylmalonyl-CoA/ethylmalonyl-CoA epimerase [Marininema halotolerans]